MHFIGPCVTVFGSARFEAANPFYQQAEKVGAALANLGFTVMTGGGPGITEAIDKGVVCSNYTNPNHTWQVIRIFKGGTALFTQPPKPYKCGGAPQINHVFGR